MTNLQMKAAQSDLYINLTWGETEIQLRVDVTKNGDVNIFKIIKISI